MFAKHGVIMAKKYQTWCVLFIFLKQKERKKAKGLAALGACSALPWLWLWHLALLLVSTAFVVSSVTPVQVVAFLDGFPFILPPFSSFLLPWRR
jgi:hypothetical protein